MEMVPPAGLIEDVAADTVCPMVIVPVFPLGGAGATGPPPEKVEQLFNSRPAANKTTRDRESFFVALIQPPLSDSWLS
jgi:hypothetical protein